MQVNKLQKIASYFFPVRIWKGSGTTNPVLELFLHRGEWQLATEDALYSDGSRYRPLVAAFGVVKMDLESVKSVLVLGSGLGSAIQIMNKMGYAPFFTLVDIDEHVLKLARELADPAQQHNIKTACADAEIFVANVDDSYDMVIIDIFNGREVPAFVGTASFIEKCRNCLNSPGILILNYMINNEADSEIIKSIRNLLPQSSVTDIGINKVLVAKV